MTTLTKEILRWIAIVLFGGFGLWILFYCGYGVVVQSRCGWLECLLLLGVLPAFAAPFFAIAYLCYRRRYRRIFVVVGILGSIAVFAELMSLPDQLGFYEFFDRHIHNGEHEWAFLAFPIGLLCLLGPIYAAAWLFRLCHRCAYVSGEERLSQTRATGWLVLLGVSCTLLSLLAMLLFFNVGLSSTAPIPMDLMHNWIVWGTGLSLVGAFLAFLGLVVRRPVSQADATKDN